jgi:hypothetical protein
MHADRLQTKYQTYLDHTGKRWEVEHPRPCCP